MKQKRLIMMLAVLAAAGAAMAQGNGQAGITEATQLVTGYFDPGTKLVYAVGAIIGLIGGVKVYQKFSSGDPDTSKTASSWFGACIFCNLQIFLCLFLEKLNMPQNTPVTKVS